MQNNVYLSKQSIFDIKQEITTPEIELKYNSLDQFNMSNPIFKQIINDFIVILKKNFPEEYLKNFYNNINELKVKNKGLKLSNGQYKIDKNQILIRKNIKVSEIRGIIYHELFHMSSSAYKKGRRYSGFSQRTKSRKMVVGNGINEGYTELLAHRYSMEKFDTVKNFGSMIPRITAARIRIRNILYLTGNKLFAYLLGFGRCIVCEEFLQCHKRIRVTAV